MAEATLRLGFKNASGESVTYNYKYADTTKSAQVRPLMEGMIVNASMFAKPPATIEFAEYIVTTTTPISLS